MHRQPPPSLCRHCRIGHHQGCTSPSCCCEHASHVPADLLLIDEGEPFHESPDPLADLEAAKACLYALEARAQLALGAGTRRQVLQLLQEMRDAARSCLAAIDPD